MIRVPVVTDPTLARRWLWALMTVAVLSVGALFLTWDRQSEPVTGAAFLVAGLVAVTSTVQAARLLTALQPRKRRSR